MKTSSAKAKGRKLQQIVRDFLLQTFNLKENDVISQIMGMTGVDIVLSPAAKKKIPYAIECKNRAKIGVYDMYEQATANTTKGIEPLLVIKADRKKPLVVVDMEHFFNLVEQEHYYRNR